MILLTVASPCALLASSTPASLSAISRAARMGMILKGGDTADNLAGLKAIVFDKTGTLTIGKPSVTALHLASEVADETLAAVVVSAENKTSHPIAQVLLDFYPEQAQVELDQLTDVTGKGFEVVFQAKIWRIGKKILS